MCRRSDRIPRLAWVELFLPLRIGEELVHHHLILLHQLEHFETLTQLRVIQFEDDIGTVTRGIKLQFDPFDFRIIQNPLAFPILEAGEFGAEGVEARPEITF